MARARIISAQRRLQLIRDAIYREECLSNDDGRYMLQLLDQTMEVNASLIIGRHRAAEEAANAATHG